MAPQSHRLRVLELSGDIGFLQRIELDCQPESPTPSPESPSCVDDRIGQISMSSLTLHFCSLCHRLVLRKVLAILRTKFF
jgi:hypothetical protein